MRPAFLAIAGPPAAVDALCQARQWPESLPRGWEVLLRLPGLFMLRRGPGSSLVFRQGAIFGDLLDRATARPVRTADAKLEQAIDGSRGACLIERHWGSWFALFADGAGGYWALRDPSPFAPVYYRQVDGVSLYHSDLSTALELDVALLQPDLRFLACWLTYFHLRTERTGLAETRELLPGTRRCVRGTGVSLDTLWSPWRFAAADRQIRDFGEAAQRLRAEALQTIPAQVQDHHDLLLELSGGLDSSIIAAALKAGGVPFDSINFVTRTAEGDERRYARAVAAETSNTHCEIEETDTPLDLCIPERRRLRPGLNAVMTPLHSQFAAHGEARGAQTFITGAGGDNVFCYLTTAAPVVDAWRVLGPAAALAQTLRDVSDLCGCTSWTTARFALRKAVREFRGAPRWRRDTDFLMRDAAPSAPEPHPWLEPPRGALPGTREHVSALLRIQHLVDPESRLANLPFLHPLIAQPLVELCLQVPTWLWVRGGHNRAVARAAFRGLLPKDVLDRRSKGRLQGMCVRAYLRHRSEIADLLLGGLLREAGLLDPTALEAYLENEGPPADARYFRIFELVSAELWLRSWR